MQETKIKWGIIGCGNIAAKFAQDLILVKNAELTAVASRSIEKATTFAQNHNSKRAYGSYEALLKDTEIDIVYIATPHISHAALSIKSMKFGKNVLCEKPLALNKNEALEIIKTAKETNRFFMEALWTRFNPVFIEVLKRIQNNEIGEVKYINADFSFKSNHSLDSRVYNLELGGGSILDIGIYLAFLTYSILGNPKNILASSIFHEDTKCDIQTSMIFEYSQAQAILYSGFSSNSGMTSKISGSEGEIHIHKRWHHADSFSIVKNEIEEKIIIEKTGIGYTHEILECHKNIRSDRKRHV